MARPRQISDEQIAAAAREAFVERGPGAPVSLVAKKLGVSHAALFHRVGTKENLMRSALGPRPPPVLMDLERSPAASPLRPQLLAILTALSAFHRQVVPGLWVLRSSGMPRPPDSGTPPPVRLRALLAAWLKRARATHGLKLARPDVIAEALLGAIEARCFNTHLGGPTYATGDDAQVIRRLVDVLVPMPTQEKHR